MDKNELVSAKVKNSEKSKKNDINEEIKHNATETKEVNATESLNTPLIDQDDEVSIKHVDFDGAVLTAASLVKGNSKNTNNSLLKIDEGAHVPNEENVKQAKPDIIPRAANSNDLRKLSGKSPEDLEKLTQELKKVINVADQLIETIENGTSNNEPNPEPEVILAGAAGLAPADSTLAE